MRKKAFVILHHVLRWGSVALMLFAVYTFASNAVFFLRAEATAGVVVKLQAMKGSNRELNRAPAIAPTISFKTAAGDEVSFESDVGYGELLTYARGEEVPVLYSPSNPVDAKVYSLFELFVLPIILLAFCGVFWVVGIVVQYLAEPDSGVKRRAHTGL